MKRIKFALKVLITLTVIFSSGNSNKFNFTAKCCPDNAFLYTSNCETLDETWKSAIELNCTTFGKYLIDPNDVEEDAFIETANGDLQTGTEDQSFVIKAGRWCVSWLIRETDTNQRIQSKLPVALACFDEDEIQTHEGNRFMSYIYGICMLISFGFLVLTLAVYVVLPELRDLQGKCLMCNVLSLALSYLPLALLQFYGDSLSDVVCQTKAFFLYFWLLAAFFWLNVVCFNIWRTVSLQGRGRRIMEEGRIFLIYCIYAWGAPLLFLVIALAIDNSPDHWNLLRPRFGLTRCWFHGPQETWAYFYGPVAILLTANVLFFLSTAHTLWINRSTDPALPRVRSLRFKCVLYFKLFIVMGITWIFEVLSFIAHADSHDINPFWRITDVLNCLQGVIIFVIMVLCRKRTLRSLASRKWSSFIFCNSNRRHRILSAAAEDDEISEPIIAEEVELARPTHENNTANTKQ